MASLFNDLTMISEAARRNAEDGTEVAMSIRSLLQANGIEGADSETIEALHRVAQAAADSRLPDDADGTQLIMAMYGAHLLIERLRIG